MVCGSLECITATSNISPMVAISDHKEGQPLDLSSLCNPPLPHIIARGMSYTCVDTGVANTTPGVYSFIASAEGTFENDVVSADTDMTLYLVNQYATYLPIVMR
jgi:hypothetical protein